MSGGVRVLMVPGWTGSGPGHWQTLWQREHPEYARVEQRDWETPMPAEWVPTLADAIASEPGDVVLVGHSLGCVTIARWAAAHGPGRVRGALLVAPCDPEAADAAPELKPFAPVPLAPLGFSAHVVASDDDPFISLARARAFATAWGADFTLVPGAEHFRTMSGHGPWPDGHALLGRLVAEWSARG